jgi:Spy/CpxP family protein refolding chaperone
MRISILKQEKKMKKSFNPILWLLLFIFIAFIAAPWSTSAQMEEGADKGGMMGGALPMMQKMMGMHGMDAGMTEMMKMMQSMVRLDLTSDQKKKIESLKLKHHKEAIPLLSRISMAQVETKELLMAEPPDLEKVKAKVREKQTAMADLEVSHLALMQQVKGVLTPEQRQKMESMMMEMSSMIESSSRKGNTGGEAKAAPKGSGDVAPEGADPHGH